MNDRLMAELCDFVARIAESKSHLWILTREAKVTQKQAQDIVAQLKGRPTDIRSKRD